MLLTIRQDFVTRLLSVKNLLHKNSRAHRKQLEQELDALKQMLLFKFDCNSYFYPNCFIR